MFADSSEEEIRSNALSGLKVNGKIGRACNTGISPERHEECYLNGNSSDRLFFSKDKSCAMNVQVDKQNHENVLRQF